VTAFINTCGPINTMGMSHLKVIALFFVYVTLLQWWE